VISSIGVTMNTRSAIVQKLNDDEYFIEVPVEILASAGIKSGAEIHIDIIDGKMCVKAVTPVSKDEAEASYTD